MPSALVLCEPGRLERRHFELPTHDANSGVLRIEACGLCGTDHEQFSGHIAAPGPFIPGHEIVGIIESVGADAAKRWGVNVGDRVAVEVFRSCGNCEPCLSGNYRRCVHHGVATMFGFVDVDVAPGLWGGYATHLFLPADALLLPVPQHIDPITATIFNPLGAGIRWGVTVPATQPGDVVAILGPGIRGLSAAFAAKKAGAATVVMTGRGPADHDRLERAKSFGADVVIDVSVDDPVEVMRRQLGCKADVVVDVTAKAPAAFAQAIRLARHGGRVVVAGTRGGGGAPAFEPDHIVYKELTVYGSLGVDVVAYRAALELLADNIGLFEQLPRQVVGFDGLPALLDVLAGTRPGVAPIHGVFAPDANVAS